MDWKGLIPNVIYPWSKIPLSVQKESLLFTIPVYLPALIADDLLIN